MPTVLALFIVGMLIVVGKSLPQRLERQESPEEMRQQLRAEQR